MQDQREPHMDIAGISITEWTAILIIGERVIATVANALTIRQEIGRE